MPSVILMRFLISLTEVGAEVLLYQEFGYHCFSMLIADTMVLIAMMFNTPAQWSSSFQYEEIVEHVTSYVYLGVLFKGPDFSHEDSH